MVEALFLSAVVALGGQADAAARRAYAALARAHEGRAYHNLAHVEAALETYLFLAEDLASEVGARVVLALCLHDAVYDPRASDNEARSACLARDLLSPLGIGREDLEGIERLILATRDHVSDDLASALVADADLAILASSREGYDAYAAAIRREYAFVPEAEYRAGRRRVLEALLARERLFVSPRMDEAAARANLRREIAVLG